MKKRILSILLAAVLLVCLLPMTALADTEVEAFNLVLMPPETGYYPSEARAAEDEYHYSTSWLSLHVQNATTVWSYLDEYNVEQTIAYPEIMKPETVYTVRITLELYTGYKFSDPPQITLMKETPDFAEWDPAQPWRVVIKKTYPATAPLDPIEKAAVTAVVPVYCDNANNYAACDSAEPYTVAGATWYNSLHLALAPMETFYDQTYTLTVTLKANDYAQFTSDLKAEDCVVNPDWLGEGKRASAVRILSPSEAELDFVWTVPPPVDFFELYANEQAYGEHPILYAWADMGVGYEVRDTKWYDESDYRFLDSEDVLDLSHYYHLEIEVYPAEGYVLSSVANATLNGVGAYSVQYFGDHILVLTDAPVKMATLIHEADVYYNEPVGVGLSAGEAATLPDGVDYEIWNVVWYDEEGHDIYEFYFEDGKTYTLKITLSPAHSYAFADDAVFRVNGEQVPFETDGNARVLLLTYDVSSWSPTVLPELFYDLTGYVGPGDVSVEKDTLRAFGSDGSILIREAGGAVYCDLDKDGTEDICCGPLSAEDPGVESIFLLDSRSLSGEVKFTVGSAGKDYLKAKSASAYYESIRFLLPDLVWNIAFDANGGSGSMADATVVRGSAYTLPACAFTAPEGKEFDKWDLGAPGVSVSVTGDLTVKALWKDKPTESWTVSFYANGGSGSMANVSVEKDTYYTLPACTFTAPEGKEFDKWDLGAPGAKILVTEDLVIVAIWKDKPAEEKKNPFVDVFDDDYYYDAVLWAYYAEPQVTTGIDATHFGPDDTVTRGQAVTFLWRAMGCPEPSSKVSPFEDVTEGKYYYKAVLWAVEKGITNGTDATHFTPNQTCSTAHIITFLYRTMGIGDNGWYQVAEAWAKGAGLLDGLKTTVAPGVDCPRCDVVLFLYRQLG